MAIVEQKQSSASGAGNCKNVATAMAIAGRASRACDVCGSQRARWYCHADNAHLCHRCDQNVHSANALARRHERVRLGVSAATTSSKKRGGAPAGEELQVKPPLSPPTSRKRSRLSRRPNPHVHVPGGGAARGATKTKKAHTDTTHEVPKFITVNIQESPVSFATHDSATAMSMAEFCKVHATAAASAAAAASAMHLVDVDDALDGHAGDADQFLVPSGYLDDFESAIAAPIESSSPSPSPDHDDDDDDERDEECYRLGFSDIVADAFEGEDTVENEEEEEKAPVHRVKQEYYHHHRDFATYDLIKKEVAAVLEDSKPLAPSLLRLDYADVLSAWSEHRSLWTDGKRPQTVPDDSTSEAAGGVLDVGVVPDMQSGYGCQGTVAGAAGGDGGREARVMRYREKRRTRLFSKKIRYEVRKLNAERRPRMKGRFVKRIPGMCSS